MIGVTEEKFEGEKNGFGQAKLDEFLNISISVEMSLQMFYGSFDTLGKWFVYLYLTLNIEMNKIEPALDVDIIK